MQRPRQHIIETESKNALANLIPSHWVLRDLPSDYGLDFMVEIFQNGNSTGNIFYLQLKGTDQNIENNAISYPLKREHIHYYNSVSNPVLFVIFSTESKQFWGLWANNLKDIFAAKGEEQQTYKLRLAKEHLISHDFFTSIEKTFTNNLPRKINIRGLSDSPKGTLYHEGLLKLIQHYYGNHIEIENNLLSSTVQFEYKEISEGLLSISIKGTRNTFNIESIDISDYYFLYHPILDTENIPTQFNKTLILISFLFHRYDIHNSIELLIKTIDNHESSLLDSLCLFEIIQEGIASKLLFQLHNLAKTAIDKNQLDLFKTINWAVFALARTDKDVIELYQNNLVYAISSLKDKTQKASLCYNLANSFRSSNKCYLANKYYQQARKNEPEYLDRAYWWLEYAGVLFLSSHYSYAEKFYKQSYKLDSTYKAPRIYSLIGDSLFFQGKFSEAILEYDKYLSEVPNNTHDEIFFKRYVCNNFLLENYNRSTFDKVNSDAIVKQALNDNQPTLYFKAIQAYPLNATAWFNHGYFLTHSKQQEEALIAFLTVACIQPNDKEAWKNCFIICLNLKKDNMLYQILGTMIKLFGKEVINYIGEPLIKRSIMANEDVDELTCLLIDLADNLD